jgi:hypothetical protein
VPFQPNLDHLVLLVNERWPSNETMGWDDHLWLAEIIARSGNTATKSSAVRELLGLTPNSGSKPQAEG